jgi:hypothetical protein
MKDTLMNTLLPLLAHTAVLIAVISAVQLTVLAFRNPLRPSWLKRPVADTLAAVAIAAGLSLAAAFEIASLVAAGVNAFAAIGITAALCFGVAYFNWRVFHCGDRLRRADAGHSPFGPPPAAPKPHRAPAASG